MERAERDRWEALRGLPSVDGLLRREAVAALAERWPRRVVVRAVRAAIADAREAILAGGAAPSADLQSLVERKLGGLTEVGFRSAINATGVILHTGLGRAPLGAEAAEALAEASRGYGLLEIDRRSGDRGKREACVAELLCELTGAEAATVVNNNAAACLLALGALCRGREVIVARGQLVEIGGSFRIPDVMEESGARLREVGATNKVHLRDYERAIGSETAAILKVHRSNFRIVGFCEEPSNDELSRLAERRGLMMIEDLGSGNLVDLAAHGLPDEPLVAASVRAGADVVTFSGDKLLSGPQAGLCVGRAHAVERMRRHPLFRALRPGKLTLAALEATLRVFRHEDAFARLPALAMLTASAQSLEPRAAAVADALRPIEGLEVGVVSSEAAAGSGALPAFPIPSVAIQLSHSQRSAASIAEALRLHDPPVFSRVREDRVLLDLRTVLAHQDAILAGAVRACVVTTPPPG